MNKWHPLFTIAWAWLMTSCGVHGETDLNLKEGPHGPFFDFPDSLFHGIYFNQKTEEAKINLVENGFELIDSSGSLHYFNALDSTEVILGQERSVSALKIILRSADQLYLRGALSDFYELSATSTQVTTDFTAHYFDHDTPRFKITIFDQEDFIRLNFEVSSKKI